MSGKFERFLYDHYTTTSEHTHLNLNGGKYIIGPEELDYFYELYQTTFDAQIPIHLVEKLSTPFKFYLDIEISEDFDYVSDVHNNQFYDQLVDCCKRTIMEICEISTNKLDDISIVQRNPLRTHIYFHNIFVDKYIALEIRKKSVEKINQIYNVEQTEFSYDKIIDKTAYNTGLRMIGSNKRQENDPKNRYIPSEGIDKESLKRYSIRSNSELLIKTKYPIEKPIENKKKKIQKIIQCSQKHNEIREILSCLSKDRCDDYEDWVKVGLALHNCDVPIYIFEEWSKNSSKYQPGCCDSIYNTPKKEEITLGTIYYMAKNDNPEKYQRILGIPGACSRYEKWTNFIGETPLETFDKLYKKGDTGAAALFSAMYRNRIYCVNDRDCKFYIWNGDIWKEDLSGSVYTLFGDHVSKMYFIYASKAMQKALASEDDSTKKNLETLAIELMKRGDQLRNTSHIKSTMFLARKYLYSTDFYEKLDTLKDYLSVKNGLVCLKTGELRDRRPDDYCSFFLDIKWPENGLNTDTSIIRNFIKDIMANDEEMVVFLQKLLGYSITGHTKEQIFVIFHGKGSNGKSVLCDLLKDLLAEKKYFKSMDKDVLIQAKGKRSEGAATAHLADLKGSRLAVAEETEQGAVLNECQIKRITGGSEITCRFLHGQPFTYKPSFQPILLTNPKPKITMDYATWRRILFFPFKMKYMYKHDDGYDPSDPFIKPKDQDLGEKLKLHLPELLVWLVQGSIEWYKNRLGKYPDAVLDHTMKYKIEQDPLAEFISNCIIHKNDSKVDFREVYDRYIEYGGKKMSIDIFEKNMKDKKFVVKSISGAKYFTNITLVISE